MRWPRLALLIAAGALGCGGNQTSGRARLFTLLDLAAIFAADPQARVADGDGFPGGLPIGYFLTAGSDETTPAELAVSSGFVEGQPAKYLTTELWAHFDEVWTQPLYLAVGADGRLPETPTVREPWVFGVGPHSRFYSPFWQVYGFQVPDGVSVESLLDARSVIEAANQTGGFRALERRMVAAAPATVFPANAWNELTYYDDSAAWDGQGDQRYIDLGPGRFRYDDHGVVTEVPLFVFSKDGVVLDDWPHVGGTRPLFSGAAPVGGFGAGGATGGMATGSIPFDPVEVDLTFGGLWRLYTVDLPADAGLDADGRVLLHPVCGPTADACVRLDSQAAIEALGADRIHRTELLATCPLIQLGETVFPRRPLAPNPAPVRP